MPRGKMMLWKEKDILILKRSESHAQEREVATSERPLNSRTRFTSY
jgi:hypothetical protein